MCSCSSLDVHSAYKIKTLKCFVVCPSDYVTWCQKCKLVSAIDAVKELPLSVPESVLERDLFAQTWSSNSDLRTDIYRR